MRATLTTLLTVSILFFSALQARADTILVTFTPDTLTAAPGGMLPFVGTLTNNTASTVFLNSDTFTFDISGAVDDSPFLLGPVSLGPNTTSASFEILDVTIPLSQAPGVYAGTFNVTGGADANASDLLGAAAFHVDVSTVATPEPASVALAALGLILLLVEYKTRSFRPRVALAQVGNGDGRTRSGPRR